MPNLLVPGQPAVFKQLPGHIWGQCSRAARACVFLSAPLEMCKHWLGSLYETVKRGVTHVAELSSGAAAVRRGHCVLGKRSHPGLKHCKILLGFVGDTVT